MDRSNRNNTNGRNSSKDELAKNYQDLYREALRISDQETRYRVLSAIGGNSYCDCMGQQSSSKGTQTKKNWKG